MHFPQFLPYVQIPSAGAIYVGSELSGRQERRQGKVSLALVTNHMCVSDILMTAWLRVVLPCKKPWCHSGKAAAPVVRES